MRNTQRHGLLQQFTTQCMSNKIPKVVNWLQEPGFKVYKIQWYLPIEKLTGYGRSTQVQQSKHHDLIIREPSRNQGEVSRSYWEREKSWKGTLKICPLRCLGHYLKTERQSSILNSLIERQVQKFCNKNSVIKIGMNILKQMEIVTLEVKEQEQGTEDPLLSQMIKLCWMS